MKEFFKTSKIIIGMAVMTLLIASCSKDQNSEKQISQKEDPEAYIKKKTQEWEARGIDAKNEVLTLEQFNEAMRRHGWAEVTKEEVMKARHKNELEERTCGYSCATWNALGDNTGDGLFSLADLVNLRAYFCSQGATPAGNCTSYYVDLGSCTNNCPPTQFSDNAILSHLAYGQEFYVLSGYDILAMQAKLLGYICCNP